MHFGDRIGHEYLSIPSVASLEFSGQSKRFPGVKVGFYPFAHASQLHVQSLASPFPMGDAVEALVICTPLEVRAVQN